MDKFLLAANPLRPDDSGTWIVHLLNPKAIIRCTEGHVEIDIHFKHYQYKNDIDEMEAWTLSAYHFFTTDFISEPEQQVIPLLDKAWRWYRSFLQSEMSDVLNIDELEWLKANKDYLSIHAIEKELNLPQATLQKFVSDQRGLSEQWQQPVREWVSDFLKKSIL